MRILRGIVFSFSVIFFIFGTRFFPGFYAKTESLYFTRLDGGKTFVTQREFGLCFEEENGLLRREVELRSSSVKKPGRCLFFGRTVFLPDKDFCAAVSENGEILLFGGAFFDRNGRLLFEFPPPKKAESFEKIFRAERMMLLGEEKLLIKSESLSFVFDTKSGVCKIADAVFL